MTTQEILETLLQAKKMEKEIETYDEAATNEVAQLMSGSFVFPLYGALWQNFLDMDTITKQLEEMYDSDNHYGLVYFIILLADAVNYDLPNHYIEMIAVKPYVPIISSAILSDWLDYHANSEVEEIEVF